MSTPTPQRGVPRAVALVAAGALACGMLAAVPAATAADTPGLARVPAPSAGLQAGRYVVLLRAPAATQYAGTDPRYAATRVMPGGNFTGRSPQVQAYSRHLVSEHESLARSVGATARRHFTVGANGFVADLTGKQAFELSSSRDVLLVTRDVARRVDTWRSPEFLGLTGGRGVWQRQTGGSDRAGDGVVVGVLDSGIWPESRSFRGKRLTRHPRTRWDIRRVGDNVRMEKADGGVFLGRCQLSHRTGGRTVEAKRWKASDCTTKIVGARYYPDAFLDSVRRRDRSEHESLSARDGEGHGSHTASTAAGGVVHGVRTEGVRFGTASGMAPAARIAAYKVCFSDNDADSGDCFTSSILEADRRRGRRRRGRDQHAPSRAPSDTVVDPVEIAFEGAAEAGIFVDHLRRQQRPRGLLGRPQQPVAHDRGGLDPRPVGEHPRPRQRQADPGCLDRRGDPAPAHAAGPIRPGGGRPGPTGRRRHCASRARSTATGSRARSWSASAASTTGWRRAAGSSGPAASAWSWPTSPRAASTPTSTRCRPSTSPTPTRRKVFRYLDRRGGRAKAGFLRGDVTGTKPTPVPQIAGFSSRGPAWPTTATCSSPTSPRPGVEHPGCGRPARQRGPGLRPLLRHLDGGPAHRRPRRAHHGGAPELDADAGQVGHDDDRHERPRDQRRPGPGPVRAGGRPGAGPSGVRPGAVHHLRHAGLAWLPRGAGPADRCRADRRQGLQRSVAGAGAGHVEDQVHPRAGRRPGRHLEGEGPGRGLQGEGQDSGSGPADRATARS